MRLIWYEGFDFGHSDAKAEIETAHDVDHGGRAERRCHTITDDAGRLIERHPHRKTIKSVGLIEATRRAGNTETAGRRYYVSSLPADPELLAYAAHALGHWEFVAPCA